MQPQTVWQPTNHQDWTPRQLAFMESNPGVVEFLVANSGWSDFFLSLLDQFHSRGSLSERQVAAIKSSQEKLERRAKKSKVNLEPIAAMFEMARSSGLRRLAYRAEGLVLTPARENSVNAGSIYVKRLDDGQYIGKVTENRFISTREATDQDHEALKLIAANPSDAATRYGRETGACACCGRELSDPKSVEAGIGPVCARSWGL